MLALAAGLHRSGRDANSALAILLSVPVLRRLPQIIRGGDRSHRSPNSGGDRRGFDASERQVARTRTDSSGKLAHRPCLPAPTSFVSPRSDSNPSSSQSHYRIRAHCTSSLAPRKRRSSITVEGRASWLDTASAAHQDAFILDQKTFADLPVKDGDILTALSSFVNPAGGAAPTIIVDGMERTDAELPLSSIQQVRINNNAYSAEFPKPGKGRIEIDTRGRRRQLHGGFIVRARNSIFDARNPMADEKLPFSRYGYEANSAARSRKRLWFFLDAKRELSSKASLSCLSPVRSSSDRRAFAGHARQFPGRLDWQATKAQRIGLKYELHIDKTKTAASGDSPCRTSPPTFYHHDYRIEISDQYVFSPELAQQLSHCSRHKLPACEFRRTISRWSSSRAPSPAAARK